MTIIADHGIHTAGWITLGVWLIGGFLLGIAVGVYVRRDGDETFALAALCVWLLAPLVVAR